MRRRGILLFLTLCCGAFAPTALSAHELPGTPYSGSSYYTSLSLDLIDVTLRLNRPNSSEVVKLKIPRAYLFYADGYSEDRFEQLPQAIDTTTINVALALPSDQAAQAAVPYTFWFDKLYKEKGRDYRYASKTIRPQSVIATLSYTAGNDLGIARGGVIVF